MFFKAQPGSIDNKMFYRFRSLRDLHSYQINNHHYKLTISHKKIKRLKKITINNSINEISSAPFKDDLCILFILLNEQRSKHLHIVQQLSDALQEYGLSKHE